MKRLTTRSIATAEAIRDREDFRTSGALYGEERNVGVYDRGYLSGPDLDRFVEDCGDITYVVVSYNTPIAWYVPGKGWHVVAQKFSRTTTKHQSNLYLVKPTNLCVVTGCNNTKNNDVHCAKHG